MSAAAIAEAMHKAGCSMEQIVVALKEFEANKRAKGREANARRQAEYRARRNANNESNAVTCVTTVTERSNENNAVTPVTSVTPSDAEIEPSRARSLCEDNIIYKNKTTNVVLQKVTAERPSNSKPRQKARTRIEPDWQPNDAGREYAFGRGMTGSDIPNEVERFVNFHLGRGTVSADWAASWRSWCGNFTRFNQPRYGPAKAQPRKTTTEDIFHAVNEVIDEARDFRSSEWAI